MFTLEQIKSAHSKVKSGAEFPAYIRDIKKLGVKHYETFVADGHTVFKGADNFTLTSEPKFASQFVAAASDGAKFKQDLGRHQNGDSSFLDFVKQCAANGVEKWVVSLERMTCTYYDKGGNVMLVEAIPLA